MDAWVSRIGNGADLLLTKSATPEPVSTVGTLTYTLTITATVSAAMGATLVNTAVVAAATFDPVTANNTATATSHTPGVNPSDTDNDALPNDWETRFGLDPNSGAGVNGAGGDPDGDGRTNFQELTEGSHPRGFVITYLAEGATGSFFNMFILIANPSTDAASVQMEYLLTNGQTITRTHAVGAGNRLTLNVAEEATQLASANMSTVVTSTNGVPIVVERAMWWPAPGFNWQEAHNSPGETVTGTRWAVAEGESGGPNGIQTYLLIANTSTFAGTARVLLVFEDGTTAEKLFSLPAKVEVLAISR